MTALPDILPVLDAELRTLRTLRRVDEAASEYAEAAFDRLLAANVEAVGGALRAARLLGRDCELRLLAQSEQVANMDVLLAEVAAGELRRLVIVETKLFRNQQQHREVLAQILDYANRLQFEVPVSEILSKVDPETRRWLEPRLPELELIKDRGDFLLVIAGDRIQPRLLDLAKPMLDRSDRALSGVQLALLSLALYRDDELTLLVPNVVGAVVRGERDLCIEVTVRSETGSTIPATVTVREREDKDMAATVARPAKRVWTKETYFEDVGFQTRDAEWKPESGLRALLTFVEQTPTLSAKWGAGKTATFTIVANGLAGPTKIAWIGSDGGISLNRSEFAEVLGEKCATALVAGLGEMVGVTVRAGAHTPKVGSDEYDYLDLNDSQERDAFQRWIMQVRDEILEVQRRPSGC